MLSRVLKVFVVGALALAVSAGCKGKDDGHSHGDKGDHTHDKGAKGDHSHDKGAKSDHGKADHAKGDHDHGKDDHDHAKGDHDHGKGDHDHGKGDHDHGTAKVELNDGKRWQADQPTTEGVRAMSAIVKTASGNHDMTAEQRAATAGELRDAYQQIFKKCTMTGAAHDQLHTFLVPMGPLLAKVEGEAEASHHALETLGTHLATYDTYFE
jgi:hypothetical protein